MLRCLVGNDLTALLGMLVQMHVSLYVENLNEKWLCASRVVFRAFGLGSGCVALVMAVERWLALTHPFIYPRVRSLIYTFFSLPVFVRVLCFSSLSYLLFMFGFLVFNAKLLQLFCSFVHFIFTFLSFSDLINVLLTVGFPQRIFHSSYLTCLLST